MNQDPTNHSASPVASFDANKHASQLKSQNKDQDLAVKLDKSASANSHEYIPYSSELAVLAQSSDDGSKPLSTEILTAIDALIEKKAPAFAFKKLIKQHQQDLMAQLKTHEAVHNIEAILQSHTALVDIALIHFWQKNMQAKANQLALIAIGGYGRAELFPGSDLDFMVFGSNQLLETSEQQVGDFLSDLWDLGFTLGHSVHGWKSLIKLIAGDLDSYTSVLESRYLAGNRSHARRIMNISDIPELWPPQEFFEGKKQEISRRYTKARGTAYNLEPNIKEGSGGLRDIHVLRWVGNRLYGEGGFQSLVEEGVITAAEREQLQRAERTLSAFRFALHSIAGRSENRLIFEYQKAIAETFGYESSPSKLAVEMFMQAYFRQIWQIRCLGEMVIQHYEEVINTHNNGKLKILGRHFQARGGFIEVRNQQVFRKDPIAIFDLMITIQEDESLYGVRSNTIRLIREAAEQLDESFTHSPKAAKRFLQILKAPTRVTRTIRRLHRYGVLDKYIPEFAPLIGQMQFDMFHVYTVDQHTIFVVRNLRRLMDERFVDEMPFATKVMKNIESPWLLLIVGLFHDIGKGRGGDHSVIGAEDIRKFGQRLQLDMPEIDLASWLVRAHLIMSTTAQKKDIDDPRVIKEFAEEVQTQERLDYLYLLTVSDIRGTNPDLWNGWKDALLETLYKHTSEALKVPSAMSIAKKADRTRGYARSLLQAKGLNDAAVDLVWRRFPTEYFYRFSPTEVAWHTRTIARKSDIDKSAVLSRFDASRAATEIMVYAVDRPRLFAAVATQLAKLSLNIYDARIISSNFQSGQEVDHNYALNSYTVLSEDDQAIEDKERLRQITNAVRRAVNDPDKIRIGGFQAPHRSIKQLDRSIRIQFGHDENTQQTLLELESPDTQGLMAMVGLALTKHHVKIFNARIATLGNKASDIFWVTDAKDQPLDDATKIKLDRQIRAELSELYGWEVSTENLAANATLSY